MGGMPAKCQARVGKWPPRYLRRQPDRPHPAGPPCAPTSLQPTGHPRPDRRDQQRLQQRLGPHPAQPCPGRGHRLWVRQRWTLLTTSHRHHGPSYGRPIAGMRPGALPTPSPRGYAALSGGAEPSGDLHRPQSQRLGRGTPPTPCRAGAAPVSGMRHSRLWIRQGTLWRMRP